MTRLPTRETTEGTRSIRTRWISWDNRWFSLKRDNLCCCRKKPRDSGSLWWSCCTPSREVNFRLSFNSQSLLMGLATWRGLNRFNVCWICWRKPPMKRAKTSCSESWRSILVRIKNKFSGIFFYRTASLSQILQSLEHDMILVVWKKHFVQMFLQFILWHDIGLP